MDGMAEQGNNRSYIIHPAKFSLWLLIISIILFFGGLTSAYIVSKGIESEKVMWHTFPLPKILWYNSIVLLMSSVMIQIGSRAARKGDLSRTKIAYILTFILGVVFLIGQVFAWQGLTNTEVVWGKDGTTAGNYLYILTAVHGFHIVAGLLFVGYVLFRLYRGKVKPGKSTLLENSTTFWHFLDLLWIYLFIFLLVNHA